MNAYEQHIKNIQNGSAQYAGLTALEHAFGKRGVEIIETTVMWSCGSQEIVPNVVYAGGFFWDKEHNSKGLKRRSRFRQ